MPLGAVELSGAGGVGMPELPGAGVGSVGAGVIGAGVVVDGAESTVSSFLSQAVSATATTEARIKVLLIMLRLL